MTELHSMVVSEQPQKAATDTKLVAPNKSLPDDRRRETTLGLYKVYGYSVYRGLHEIIMNVNCRAHVRRKFVESAKDASAAKRLVTRIKEPKPILDEFWAWIEQTHALAKTKLGITIEYAAKLRDGLMDFMTDGRIMISNKLVERRVHPMTIGRKN